MTLSVILLIGLVVALAAVALSLTGAKEGGAFFGNCLIFLLAVLAVTGALFWFLMGDSLRSFLD